MTDSPPEVWLRGPIRDVPAPLQPAAHALLQAAEDVEKLLRDFPDEKLWARPADVASVGFHLQHMRGVIDRLFTYAAARPLADVQRAELAAEGVAPAADTATARLVEALRDRVQQAVVELSALDERTLSDLRTVGRKQLPSTVQGLLFHAAEHVQRHVGQLLVTVRILNSHTPSA